MDKTRLALIGAGMMGKRHLKAIREVDEAEVVAMVDSQPELIQLAEDWSVLF